MRVLLSIKPEFALRIFEGTKNTRKSVKSPRHIDIPCSRWRLLKITGDGGPLMGGPNHVFVITLSAAKEKNVAS